MSTTTAATPTSASLPPKAMKPSAPSSDPEAVPSPPKKLKASDDRTKSRPKGKTAVQFEIANKSSLSDLSKRYNPPPPLPETSLPLKKSTYFEKLDVATRLELDHGISHIIDVQPDLRFPLQYFMYNIAEEYPDLTTRSHPYVSTFTLIAYEQLLFNAYLLACDLHARDTLSYHATFYKNDSLRSDYFNKLMNCYVPSDLETLLLNLAPTYDPQRRLQLYVPSLAAFDFALDIGRCVPLQCLS